MKVSLKSIALFIAATAFVSIISPAATAVTIPGLFNTGVLNDNSLASSGRVNLHYVLTVSADPSSIAIVK